jgi:hypothetical protein
MLVVASINSARSTLADLNVAKMCNKKGAQAPFLLWEDNDRWNFGSLARLLLKVPPRSLSLPS